MNDGNDNIIIEYTPRFMWCKGLMLDLLQSQKPHYIQLCRPSDVNIDLEKVCGRAVGYSLSNTKPGVINIEVDVLDQRLNDLVDCVQLNMCSVHTNTEDHSLCMFYFDVREGSNND